MRKCMQRCKHNRHSGLIYVDRLRGGGTSQIGRIARIVSICMCCNFEELYNCSSTVQTIGTRIESSCQLESIATINCLDGAESCLNDRIVGYYNYIKKRHVFSELKQQMFDSTLHIVPIASIKINLPKTAE